jgi:3-hydroxyacyl-[acyl-carrier-protein] dehydratase
LKARLFNINILFQEEKMIPLSLDIKEIQQYQRNRYPYLLIDKITELVPGKSAKGYKNFTMNEWFFPTHFENDPIVPGMLQIESLVQVFIMTFLSLPEYKGKVTNFLGANNVKFFRYIIPGDRLEISSELISVRRGIAKGSSEGYIDGKLTCRSDFLIGIPEVLSQFTPKKFK